MTYIDVSHATWLSSSISVDSFVATLFGGAVYYMSKLQAMLATRSTESEFMAAVPGDISSKYISSILEELVFAIKVPTELFCGNTAAIMVEESKKQTNIPMHIHVHHFALQ